MKKTGIYKITSPSGKIYIGQSVDIQRRFKTYLRGKTNSQVRLHNSFKKYGIENHQFDIIEYCSEEELNCSERFWQDEFDVSSENGLNCSLQNCGEKRYKHSEETIKRISLSRIGSLNPNWGKPMSEEAKEKRRNNPNMKSKKGTKMSEDACEKMRGKREKIARANHPKSKKVVDTSNGNIFGCITDAAEYINMDRRKLSSMLSNSILNTTNLKLL